jgi:hypothetical protein
MKAIIVKVQSIKTSRHGGKYQRAIFKDITLDSIEKEYTFDCYHNHTASARFIPYLKEQAMFDNVDVIEYNGKKVISGNSNFKYLGQRH